MHILKNVSRRVFLRQAGAMSALVGGAAPLALNLAAMSSASAQTSADYKAIVCLFLYGGNDSFNMVLPTDTASWSAYSTTRNVAPDPIALLAPGTAPNLSAALGSPARLGGVIPITPLNGQSRTFALHPLLASLQTLFNGDAGGLNKRLAVIPNMGPLIMQTTKAQYALASYPKPPRLFSHDDQQNTWQALGPEGSTLGWGGRIGDALVGSNTNSTFTAISAAGNAVWVSGSNVHQYQVSSSGAIVFGANATDAYFGTTDSGLTLRRLASTVRSTNPFEADVAAVAQRAMDAEAILRTALKPASDALFGTPVTSGTYSQATDPKLRYVNPLVAPTTPPTTAANALAQQLQVVARMIEAGMTGTLGARRQVFFVSLGGFDTHDGENRSHADLYARIDQALSYFDTTLGGISVNGVGARDAVTTFTASDFGRTFLSNGDGSDHGWGSHHFVMGGAVKGGDLYGTFPVLGLKNTANSNFDSSPDQLGSGVLLPTTSVDQLGATLARWLGLSDTQIADIFPNLANWAVAKRDLGFFRQPATA